ncbi:venom carboxylesterase-6-like [Leptopilina heterotoma]|uniref:venom carboxylesterase-6-like n=1 Tax=Leptopilina heterotoma TaxID=63436 RepID=UPI001CA918DE|nr:venom carboxylesterase-6-like [Leptopilina heterotoma]XP_043477787.1 venom carboxylesterase-6-like [Leptopilina heterotoma]XP_043477788.1 venom carboxylesterase-6-like [Leptopilina heterotoma]
MNLLIPIILGSIVVISGADPIVKIKNGTIEGTFMKSRKGREIAAFRGIPYALPPLGELRFEPPKPAASWKNVLSAKEDPNICTQRNIYTHQEEVVGEEDCLYLNVYTPQLSSSNSNAIKQKNYPVMLWFHGGGWVTGAGNFDFYGPKFLLDHEVILVTINFRLGPLGFLSTEDLVIPGNQGMKDQAQSIRWVHENIAEFGGDPNRVTLFGESAGGVSTHYHMISPLSRGLFHRGISQSGTALCPWGLTRPGLAKKQAEKLGKLMDCTTSDSRDLLKCLKTKNHIDIIARDRAFQVFDYCPMIPFRPVIEPNHPGAFLKEDPAISLKDGNIADIPWMTGISSHEGAIKSATIYGLFDGKLIKELNDNFEKIAPLSLLYEDVCPKHLIKNVTKSIRKFYLGDRNIDESTRLEVTHMYSDAWFIIGADNAVRDHLDVLSSPIYYYYFAYRGSVSFSRIFGDEVRDYGVSHADDLQYLFPVGEQLFQETPLSAEDNKIIDVITELWVNFANSGNPTPEITTNIPLKWKSVKTHDLEYLHIENSKKMFMGRNLLHDRIQFWNNLPYREAPTLRKDSLRDEL